MNSKEASLPSYEHEHEHEHEHEDVPSYEHAPDYETTTGPAGRQARIPTGMHLNLTLDPTGTFIKTLPSSDASPLYTLTKTLFRVSSTTSIHVKRPEANGDDLEVYAIGEHFISPLHTKKRELQYVTAARSHGFLVSTGVREIVWDFSTRVRAPIEKDNDGKDVNPSSYPTDPVYMIGTAPGPGTVEKHLLQFCKGEWVDADDEVVALEREGGAECEGMPVLSVTKELDQETMDFLVSAWCVTMWGQVGKRHRRSNKSANSKFSFGKVKLW
jgi:hypothetical protein